VTKKPRSQPWNHPRFSSGSSVSLLVYLPRLGPVLLWHALPPGMVLVEFPKLRKPLAVLLTAVALLSLR